MARKKEQRIRHQAKEGGFMRGIWAGSPALVLGVVLTSVQAQENFGRPAAASSPQPPGPSAEQSRCLPAVTLGRPVPMPASGMSLVRPAAYDASAASGEIVRAKGPDFPQPMPAGQPLKGPPLLEVPDQPQSSRPIATTPEAHAPGVEASAAPYVAGDFASDAWCGTCPDLCGPGACSCPEAVGCTPNRYWFSAEYLLWNTKQHRTPPLVTTSNPPDSLGVLGMPGTGILFGGVIDNEDLSGARFTVGGWLDACEHFGLEGSIFFLGRRSARFDAASNGTPLLARPFFNANPAVNAEDAQLVANPALASIPGLLPLTGRINVSLSSQLWGFETNALCNLCRGCWGRADLIGGFRYLRLRDSLDISENLLVPLSSPVAAGQTTFLNDHFATRNQFFGPQVGVRGELDWRRWQLDVTAKVALGSTYERVNIDGATIITPLGGPSTAYLGGLLAQPTNIGQFSRDRFAVVPEIGLNLGYKFTDHLRAFVGYDFLYWSSVARLGDQIDRTVNSTQIAPRTGPFTGPARPAFEFKNTDYWAHGVNFGVEFRY
jgi:hypothetical protein